MTTAEFERLWSRHRPALERRARSLFSSPLNAEEAMGELLLAALKAYPRLPSDGTDGFMFRAWILYMLRMESRGYYTRQQKRVLTCVPLFFERPTGETGEHPGMIQMAKEQHRADVEASEARHLVGRILDIADTLKNRRAAFILRNRARGRTLEEIGQDLGITREYVRQIAARAEITIRKKLEQQGALSG